MTSKQLNELANILYFDPPGRRADNLADKIDKTIAKKRQSQWQAYKAARKNVASAKDVLDKQHAKLYNAALELSRSFANNDHNCVTKVPLPDEPRELALKHERR